MNGETSAELKKIAVTKLLGSLAEIVAAEEASVFTIPGLARIKTRRKPASKATKRIMFDKIYSTTITVVLMEVLAASSRAST